MATSAQRLFARWRSSLLRHRHRQHLLATLLGLWLGSFTLWHYRAAVRTAAAGTGRKTAVHETVDRWHLDDERLPLLNSMRDSRCAILVSVAAPAAFYQIWWLLRQEELPFFLL